MIIITHNIPNQAIKSKNMKKIMPIMGWIIRIISNKYKVINTITITIIKETDRITMDSDFNSIPLNKLANLVILIPQMVSIKLIKIQIKYTKIINYRNTVQIITLKSFSINNIQAIIIIMTTLTLENKMNIVLKLASRMMKILNFKQLQFKVFTK